VRTFANPGFSRDSASDNGWCSSVSVKKNDATSADAPEPLETRARDVYQANCEGYGDPFTPGKIGYQE
jgi:hypothetical protein